MESIKHLPEAVHSSVRSGIMIFDLTRVVEELVFNSLDAGASKVSIAVAVGTCCIKVADNGSGIARDGLVLLGNKYTTSKVDTLADMDVATGSFGFRGEALGSISDVSVLEIVTKAHGRPNGYRKVIKGCKCLYLGIDDSRQDVGTTVIIRDLFYNQPVRRKHMQSSPKKALHSVKKCILRIALVHPEVSFKVFDIESDDELLHTYASPSPLSILTSGFGFEVSSSLHELNVSDCEFKLSGYISGDCDTSFVKAFQYVYINSRYICKGPIHKLLNQLATRFNSLDLWKANAASQNGKQNRSQTYAAYIINLRCPHSCYDLTFEPSKTSVVFKDWIPILSFIEKTITQFWSNNTTSESQGQGSEKSGKGYMWKEGGNIVSAEEANHEIAKKRSRIENHKGSLGLPSPLLGMLAEETNHKCPRKDSIFSKSHHNATELEEHQTEVGFISETDRPFQSFDGSLTQCRGTVNQECDSMWASDDSIFFAKDNFLRNKSFSSEKSNELADKILGLRGKEVCLDVSANLSNGFPRSTLSCDSFDDVGEVCNDLKKPFLRSCSRRSLPPDKGALSSDGRFEFQTDSFRTKRKWFVSDDSVDIGEFDREYQDLDFCSGTLWQEEAESGCSSLKLVSRCDMHMGMEFLSRGSDKSFPIGGDCLAEENDLPPDSVAQTGNFGSSRRYLDSEWSPPLCRIKSDDVEHFLVKNTLKRPIRYETDLPPDSVTHIGKFGSSPWSFDSEWSSPIVRTKSHDMEHFMVKNTLKRPIRCDNSSRYNHWADREGRDGMYIYDTMRNNSSQEYWTASNCTDIFSDIKSYAGSEEDICRFLQGHNMDDMFFPTCSDNKTEWLCSDSPGNDSANHYAFPSDHIPSPIYLDKVRNQRDQIIGEEEKYVRKRMPGRSHSAPPFHRGKKNFFALNNPFTTEAGEPNSLTVVDASASRETSELKQSQLSSVVAHLHSKPNSVEDCSFVSRPDRKETTGVIENPRCEMQKKSQGLAIYIKDSAQETSELKPSQLLSLVRDEHSKPSSVEDLPFFNRRGRKEIPDVIEIPKRERQKKSQGLDAYDMDSAQENSELKRSQLSAIVRHQHFKPSSVEDLLFFNRPDRNETPDAMEIPKGEMQKKSQDLDIYNKDSAQDTKSMEFLDSWDSEVKWRNSCPHIANGDRSHNLHNQDSILDICSGLLHLSGDSLVPDAISKSCLEKAKVLQQVDKKFIPVVAGEVLAIIDQHAADERIRLEELRRKVLSGEMKTITYLDAEQELVLPEIGYQLLHNYAEQIQTWGWICNIHAHDSRSFKMNLNLLHRQPSVITLLAVPSILGVNLSEIDLLEFLQQLADTDGSSTIPPSVLRILSFKACRGAIMFGDTLLPSECSLLVEELKLTSLCFQCAHGRPTTVPLVNLRALQEQITKLGLENGNSDELWHGLRRHKLSVERAAQRLSPSGVHS